MTGVSVSIAVLFRCDENEPLAEVAKEYAPRFGDDYESLADGVREACYFITDISQRTGPNPGRKGGLCTWGTIGNYTPPERFVEELRPFFLRLWLSNILPLDERVLVLAQRKGGEPFGFTIGLDAWELTAKKRQPNLKDVKVLTDILAHGWYER